jgi:branched-chain amino acid transport system permease protein
VFALMALALALLFGVMGLMNFAYGELIMVGGYTMYLTRDQPWPVLVIATIGVVTVFALLQERLAFRPLRSATPMTLLIASFAVSYGLQQIAWMTIGRGPAKGVPPYPVLRQTVDIGGVLISRLTILTAVVTIALMLGMTLLLKKTMLGVQLRASTEDFRMAQLSGVRANGVIVAAFAITGVLAGVAALLFVMRGGSVTPTMGTAPLLVAFVGGVIGGLGSLPAAALGGFVLGALTTALQAALPLQFSSHTQLFAFLIVIAILVLKPQGLVALRPQRILTRWRKRRLALRAGEA